MTHNTAVILAAGRGSRLKEISLEHPKPMVVVSHQTIISNLINLLTKYNYEKIIVVIGYKAMKLKDHIIEKCSKANLVFIENGVFLTTNNIYSLWLAKEHLKDGFSLFEADVFFSEELMENFVKCKDENVILVGNFVKEMEGTVVTIDKDNVVNNMFLKRDQYEGFLFDNKFKTVNFYKLGKNFVQEFFLNRLEQHIYEKDINSYYELIIKEAINNDYKFTGLNTGNANWWEIDTQDDLEIAKQLFLKRI